MLNVLLVIDLQPTFKVEPYYSKLLSYIENNRKNYDIIAATIFHNTEDSPFVRYCNYSDAIQLESLDFTADMIIEKSTYGIGEKWCKYFDKLLADITVIGCDTDACVLSTCYDLFDNGNRFNVLTDYCYSSGGDEIHKSSINIMKRNFGNAII